jgi:hypothetical protein
LGYFLSLLIANMLQGVGTVMNLKWVHLGGVLSGYFCTAQGVLYFPSFTCLHSTKSNMHPDILFRWYQTGRQRRHAVMV